MSTSIEWVHAIKEFSSSRLNLSSYSSIFRPKFKVNRLVKIMSQQKSDHRQKIWAALVIAVVYLQLKGVDTEEFLKRITKSLEAAVTAAVLIYGNQLNRLPWSSEQVKKQEPEEPKAN